MEQDNKELLKLIASGALSGALLGAGGRFLSGAKSIGSLASGAATGAGLSGGLTGLSGAIGLGVGGTPSEEESSGYSTRLGIGGGIAGGLAGAGLGALMASKGGRSFALDALKKVGAGSFSNEIKRGSSLLGKAVGGMKNPGYAAAGLGALGATVGGYQGLDEGMQMDFLHNLSSQEKERLLRKKTMEAFG